MVQVVVIVISININRDRWLRLLKEAAEKNARKETVFSIRLFYFCTVLMPDVFYIAFFSRMR